MNGMRKLFSLVVVMRAGEVLLGYKKTKIGMWQDDRFWLPLVLANKAFIGDFRFIGRRVVSRRIKEISYDQLEPEIV